MLYFDVIFLTGIIYDVIVEPPSVGSTTDEHGHTRPVSKYNKNQFIILLLILLIITYVFVTGSIYAVSCKWSIHYGRISV